MYHTPTALKPPLGPDAFHSKEHWELERAHVFEESWHLVGTTHELAKTGSFITADVLNVPVLVRNFGDELVALRNVCAHRQCSLATKAKGQSETLKCPFHGWEYGSDGRTRKIPAATNFPHFDREAHRLDQFQVQTCGQLVFVRLSKEGPSLKEWTGERFAQLADWFGDQDWKQTMSVRFDYASNWKIPLEAALESYHIPCIHANTFAEDPGEKKSEHYFYDTGTSFTTAFQTPRFVDSCMKVAEQSVLWGMGIPFTGSYQHHHFFPNLLISHTDSLSLAQVVHPQSESTAYGRFWQFGCLPKRRGFAPKLISSGWGKFATYLTSQILHEDLAVYPMMQTGVQGANKPGMLGRCEERLYASQKFVADQIAGKNYVPSKESCESKPAVTCMSDQACQATEVTRD